MEHQHVDTIPLCINTEGRDKNWNMQALNHKFKNYDVSPDELASAINQGYAIVCARMVGNGDGWCHRKSENFISSQTVAIDIDNSVVVTDDEGKAVKDINGKQLKKRIHDEKYFSLTEALNDKYIQDNALMVYTTPSYSPEWNRFRIIFHLPHLISDPVEYQTILRALITKYGGDSNCSDLCRIFFGSYGSNPTVIGSTMKEDEFDNILKSCLPSIICKESEENIEPDITQKKEPSNNTFPPISLEEVREMLVAIVKVKGRLEYMDWLKIASAIWSQFSLDDSLPVLKECMPEEGEFEYEKQYTKRLQKLSIGTLVHMAMECGYKRENIKAGFMVISPQGKLKIHMTKLLNFIIESGFNKYYPRGTVKYMLIKTTDNVAKEVSVSIIKDYICRHLKEALEIGDNDNYTLEDVMQKLICGSFITPERMEFIDKLNKPFHTDNSNNSFIYLQDGYLHLKRLDNNDVECKFFEYSNLQGVIWEQSKRQHRWCVSTNQRDIIDHGKKTGAHCSHCHREGAGEFEQFICHVCNMEEERITALQTALGYVLYRHKVPSNAKAIIFCDERISDNPAGGTGKSLIAVALSHVRSVAIEDGRKIDLTNRFALQKVDYNTELIVFDDVVKNFNFEKLFHMITSGVEFEHKGKQSVKLSFEESPKVLITTNYIIKGQGDSSDRRKAEYEIHPWYDKYFSPRDEFGHDFFSEWDGVEWQRFYEFMANCICQYMRLGLVVPQPKNLLIRKLIQETSPDFIEWADDKFKINDNWNDAAINRSYTKRELYQEFCERYPDYHAKRNKGLFTQQKFSKWVKAWAIYNKLSIEESVSRQSGTPARIIQFLRTE